MNQNLELPQIKNSSPTEGIKVDMSEIQSMLRISTIGMAVISEDTKILEANQHLCTILGYTRQELLILSYPDIVLDNDLSMHGVENNNQVRKYLNKKGQTVWGYSSLRKVVVKDQETILFIDQVYDITKEKMLESACNSMADELKELSYSVSHDLRSPLRSILGFSQALKEDEMDNLSDEGKDHLKRIYNASVRMGKMLDELLGLARLSLQKTRPQNIDLTQLIKETIEGFKTDSKYNFEIEEGLVTNGDLKSIKKLFENLIDNAIKFSSKEFAPTIKVGTTKHEGSTVFYVRDNGAGFDQAYADKLFGAYQRLHTPEEFEGTGMGLAIVKRIVSQHGGKIWAESKPNRGATFYLTFSMS
ncbi:MAG TPA: ATP-binding protein [Fulvivirga sp.]|nr:ATP-binding protein [Fulvivirga sp.]